MSVPVINLEPTCPNCYSSTPPRVNSTTFYKEEKLDISEFFTSPLYSSHRRKIKEFLYIYCVLSKGWRIEMLDDGAYHLTRPCDVSINGEK